jgi:hypothetical protein
MNRASLSRARGIVSRGVVQHVTCHRDRRPWVRLGNQRLPAGWRMDRLFVVLLEQDGYDETHDGLLVGESVDTHWFTDPHIDAASEGGRLLNSGNPLTEAQTPLAANYGCTVDRMRYLDGWTASACRSGISWK